VSEPERQLFDDPEVQARYALVSRIGWGASSSVYEALQRSTGRRVAIKVLRLPGDARVLDQTPDAARFRRETRLCAQLHHPNIVSLVDSGEVAALLYAVFELVPGLTLSEVLTREGALEPVEALHLMTQVLDALSCSHAMGIVHRDLKPANIMITRTGARRNAMVLDFGLGVLAVDAGRVSDTRLTSDGEYLGTPLYSAPEQLRGQAPTVQSDLYAWGLILLECLTGMPAITGRSVAEVVHSQLSLQPLAIPRALAQHPLGRLLRTATIKQPPASRGAAATLLNELSSASQVALPSREALRSERRSAAAAAPGEAPTALEALWRVPPPRNTNFTGRRQLLTALHEALGTDPPPALLALTGLGGIGKTQIALEYAYRHAGEYELVAWLRAEEGDALAADYAALAEVLELPERDTRDLYPRIEAVRRWLERSRRWLLVFDNAPTPDDIRPYLPHSPTGHVLATSRYPGWRSLGMALPVDVLEPAEAAEFLVSRTGDRQMPDALRLCEDLGRLPLALEEAAAYIEATGRSISTYRRLLESNRLRLLEEGTPPADYPWTVRSTWEISLQRLEAETPQAAQLLCLCAYLAPDDIPLAELRAGLAQLGDGPLAPLLDEIALDRCVAALRRYSLVKLGDGALSLHRLVQLVTRDRLAADERAAWADRALRLVEAVFPRSGLAGDVRPEAARLLPHSLAALGHVEALPQCDERAAQLLSRTGIYMSATGVHSRAIEHLTKALRIFDRHPELGDRERAAMLDNVAVVQNARGEVEEARVLLERALAIHERLDGPDAVAVGLDLVNLAWVRRVLGERQGARAAAERGARIIRARLGAAHPILATVQSVGARVDWELGDFAAARRLMAEVLELLDRARSRFHPMMAGAWFQAGLLAFDLGELERAESCASLGAGVGAPAYGPDHPLVLSNLVVAGQVLLEREAFDEARATFERVVAGSGRTSARPHADLAVGLPLLAETQRRGGDPRAARRTAEQALGLTTLVAGDAARAQSTAHRVLGSAFADLGDAAAAAVELERAGELLAVRLGDRHPAALPVVNARAQVHLQRGDLAAARAAGEQALALAAGAGLEQHHDVAAALELLAAVARRAGDAAAALPLLTQAQAIARRRCGDDSRRAQRLAALLQEVARA